MIHKLPTHILEQYIIPNISDNIIYTIRESSYLFTELTYKRFSKIQSKKIQQLKLVHNTVTIALFNHINSIIVDNIMIKQDYIIKKNYNNIII